MRRIKSWKYTPEWRCVDERQFRKLLAVARAVDRWSKGDPDNYTLERQTRLAMFDAMTALNAKGGKRK